MQDVCIIIPCYNEEKRFPVEEFFEFYSSSDCCFCLVNDGSSDSTLALLQFLSENRENRIKVVNLKTNSGKAEAVRQGVLEALSWKSFEYIGYFDADFSAPLNAASHLYSAALSHPEVAFIFGARVKLLGREVVRSARRHYLGRLFSTVASIILDLPVYDTQCGAKLIKADLAEIIFQQPLETRWLFDVELFARAVNYFGKADVENKFVEVPLLRWVEKGGSKLKMKHLIKVPFDLISIKFKYKSGYKNLAKHAERV